MVIKRCVISVFFALLAGLFVIPVCTYAQLFTAADSVQLLTDPTYPNPQSSVEISLDAYSVNTAGASIQWYVDGAERTDARNERSLTITTGDVGESQVVTAKITLANGIPLTASQTITPSEVDIVLEANTYVPPFYKGRALPSSEAPVRIIAIPHTAPMVPFENLTYEWQLGEEVLFGGPVKGKYAAEITMPRFEDEYISVRITNPAGRAVGGRTIFLNPSEPELHFYEENPLRGLSNKAIIDSLTLIGEETTIHAEPFFMVTDLKQDTVTFNWTINGAPVTSNSSDPHMVTLRRTGGTGNATIKVDVLTKTTIPQYAQKIFNVLF